MIELQNASDSSMERPSKLSFVEIAFARSPREAMRFRESLSRASIAADIESGGNRRRGVAILVESSNLVPASEILADAAQERSACAYDDDEEEDDDFDDEDDDFSDDDDDYDDDDDIYDDDEDADDDDYESDDDE